MHKEDVNEAYKNYGDVLTLEEDKDSSYKWFDQCDREFHEFRARVTEKIHVLERDISSRGRLAPSISNYSKTSHRSKGSTNSHLSKGSSKSHQSEGSSKYHRSEGSSKSHRSEGSSRSSARERRASAAARVARLEVEKKFVDKESEIRKIQLSKKIAMANAEEIAMKKIVDEEEKSTRRYKNITTGFTTEPDTMLPSSSKVERVIKNETGVETTIKTSPIPPTKSEDPTSILFPILPPTKSEDSTSIPFPIPPTKPEESTSRNFEDIQLRLSSLPVERKQIGTQSQTTGTKCQSTHRENDASINDILYLQAKQTELSAMIVEQHRTSLLPLKNHLCLTAITLITQYSYVLLKLSLKEESHRTEIDFIF